MKKLDKFILKSYLGPLLLTFTIAMFVLMLQFLWQKMESLIGKGLDTAILLKMIAYASATLVPMALPLAVLLASIMTLGNFSEKYELAAMKASGISLWRVLRPLIILSVLLSGLAFYFSNSVMPKADEQLRLMINEIKTKKPALNIKPNEFYSEIDNYIIRIGGRNEKNSSMQDILIYDHSKKQGNNSVIKADSGYMYTVDEGNTLVFELINGESYSEDVSRDSYSIRPLTRIKFKKQILRFDVSNFAIQKSDSNRYKDSYRVMNIARLSRAIDSLEVSNKEDREGNFANIHSMACFKQKNNIKVEDIKDRKTDFYQDYQRLNFRTKEDVDRESEIICKNIRGAYEHYVRETKLDQNYLNRHKIEYHNKFTLSLACLILFFIGAPLGAIIKKGGFGMPIVVSIIAFILYYTMGQIGSMLSRGDTLTPFVGMWLSSFVFFPIGLFLTLKATSDAKLFDIESYKKFFSKFKLNKKSKDNI